MLRGLYPIVDVDSLLGRAVELDAFARALFVVRPPLVQLRAKHASARETLELLRRLREPTRAAGILLFANDRPDLARLGECDGVHVGQEDLDVEDVRRVAPGLRVGVSTHNPSELARALERRPDYVAFGPVFATASKARPDPTVGLDGLADAAERARKAGVVLCAIGGIDLERAPRVAEHAALAAVIGALLPGPAETLEQVTERARALHVALGGER